MCMLLQKYSRKKGKKAKKDLFCWKYFSRLGDKIIATPVYRYPVREEKGYLLTPDEDRPDICGGIVYGGVIHAARCDYDGRFYINETITFACPVIALMVIPKGTRYWVGDGGCLCAERMEYLQTYRTPDGEDVGNEPDSFAAWYDEMGEWLIDNEVVY